jgi:hypothetical protein
MSSLEEPRWITIQEFEQAEIERLRPPDLEVGRACRVLLRLISETDLDLPEGAVLYPVQIQKVHPQKLGTVIDMHFLDALYPNRVIQRLYSDEGYDSLIFPCKLEIPSPAGRLAVRKAFLAPGPTDWDGEFARLVTSIENPLSV